MQNDDIQFYPSSRRETLATLAVSALTLLTLGLAAYYTPTLLVAVLR